jgi:hypothetical protein
MVVLAEWKAKGRRLTSREDFEYHRLAAEVQRYEAEQSAARP